jgi:heat shock protein HtpX
VWEQIQSNRRRAAAVVVGMAVLLVATGVAFGLLLFRESGAWIGALIALGVWAALWVASVQGGDDLFLRMAGAKRIQHADHPVLANVVEEMSIAAQLPQVPALYVVDDPSPNAFATGRDPRKASVAVTTGLLGLVDRDELQGVVAHEIGHIKNRDVSLLVTAGIMVGAIVFLGEIAWRALYHGGGRIRARSSSRSDRGGQAAVAAIAILLLALSPLLAQLLYFALSRRREYLADASGALFSRYPEGLASALEKMSASTKPLADRSRVTAPMYIVPPQAARAHGGRSSLFATHPATADRIRILRSMDGGAGLREYEAAFRRVRGRSVVGARSLAAASEVAARPATATAAAETPARRADRVRQASDAFLAGAGFSRRRCTRCGAILKIPPALEGRVGKCVRCGGELAGAEAAAPAS